MKRKTKIIAAVGVAVVTLGAWGGSVLAKDSRWFNHGRSHHGMMSGGMHGPQMIEKQFERHDLNKDGTVIQEEVDQLRSDEHKTYDENKDGLINLSEFQNLWIEFNRDRIVDIFQVHDNDGDGKITKAEFLSPMAKIIARHDTNDDGKISMKELRQHTRRWGHKNGYKHDGDNKRDKN